MRIVTRSPYGLVKGRDASQGGNVLYNVGSRMFARSYGSPVPGSSQKQVDVRYFFTNVAQIWAGLTPDEVATWVEFAKTYKSKDKFGQTFRLSPFQAFQRIGYNGVLAGSSTFPLAPTSRLTPSIRPPISIDHDGTADETTIAMSNFSQDGSAFIQVAGPFDSPNVTPRQSNYTSITLLMANAYKSIATATPEYTYADALLAFTFAPGDFYAIKITPISTQGLPGTPYEQIVTVTGT
jgi:hypothetical protein